MCGMYVCNTAVILCCTLTAWNLVLYQLCSYYSSLHIHTYVRTCVLVCEWVGVLLQYGEMTLLSCGLSFTCALEVHKPVPAMSSDLLSFLRSCL